MQLDGKIAIVTGGNAGIGLASARRLVAEGATVFAMARRREALDKTAGELGPRFRPVAGDITQTADLARLFQQVKDEAGHLDILVANAGAVRPTPLGDVTEEHFDQIFDLNARATLFTIKGAVPLMAEGGSIVLIGSTAADTGIPGYLTYAGTKAAIRSYARTLAAEFGSNGIRINVVTPGPIETDMIDDQAGGTEEGTRLRKIFKKIVPLGRLGTADEVASVVRFLASSESSFVTGTESLVDGGVSQL